MQRSAKILIAVLVSVVVLGGGIALIFVLTSNNDQPAPRAPVELKFWGAATASYQIEGGWDADGKGRSVWDEFSQSGGKVQNNDTGDVACLSYYKYKEDVQLLKAMHLSHYRFSVSWPRVLPQGAAGTPVNEKGIEYYNNLIDELRSNGIEPAITLYHWDLPQALQDKYNGWMNESIIDDFVNYADLLFSRFGDRVKTWITLNEPNINTDLGYARGYHAPGIKLPKTGPYIVGHHMLLAHAKVYHMYGRKYRADQQGTISITLDAAGNWPKDESKQSDVDAAERAMEFALGKFAHPLFYGDYPKVVKDKLLEKSLEEGLTKSRLPEFTPEQKAELINTTDYFGLNLYTGHLCEYENTTYNNEDVDVKKEYDPNWGRSGSEWLRVVPRALRMVLNWIRQKYGNPPVMVTENGISDKTGYVVDPWRRDYYDGYINAAFDAKEHDGCNLVGYFAWSLLDNFEWAEGYTEKFGLTSIDYTSPERTRTPKQSSKWYGDFVRYNRRL